MAEERIFTAGFYNNKNIQEVQKKKMIIAGFAGVGKTCFCEKHKNAIDFECMPFKYMNFYKMIGSTDKETVKAGAELELRIGWEDYYYYALLDTYKKYPDEVIVIPTIKEVLKRLEKDGIPVVVVLPGVDAKEEFEERYRKRGNTEEFVQIFTGWWDEWIKRLKEDLPGEVIELGSGQYLSDVIKVSEYEECNIIMDKEHYIFDTYFKNGWAQEFAETPKGSLMQKYEESLGRLKKEFQDIVESEEEKRG